MIINDYRQWDEEIREDEIHENDENTFLSEDNEEDDNDDEEEEEDSFDTDDDDDNDDETEVSATECEEPTYIKKTKETANNPYVKNRPYNLAHKGFCGRCLASGCHCKQFEGRGDTCENCGHAFNKHC